MNSEIALILPLPVIFVVLTGLGFYIQFKSNRPIRFAFSILMILAGAATLLDMFIYLSSDLQQALIFNALQYVPNVLVPTSAFLFILRYINRDDLVTPLTGFLLHIVPAIVLFAVWTNPVLHLYYQDIWLGSIGGLHTLDSTWAPFFLLHVVYNVVLIIGGLVLLLRFSLRSNSELAENAQLVAIGFSLPLIFSVGVLSMGWSGVTIYSESIGYLIAAIIAFWEVFRLEVVDMTPLVHSMLIDDIDDAAIIIDNQSRIREINRAAEMMLDLDVKQVVGEVMSADMIGLPEVMVERMLSDDAGHFNINISFSRAEKYYDISITPLRDVRGDELGRMFIMVDNTDRETMVSALRASNLKLNLLSTVTRHDILNQITVVGGYAEMLRAESGDDSSKYIDRILDSTRKIQQLIAFSSTYQGIGVSELEWINVGHSFLECARGLVQDVQLDVPADGIEIQADPMVQNVFLNLMDNTNRHGAGAGSIKVSWHSNGGSIKIVYEDDGIGIPESDKNRIFDQDFGKNSGIGLYAIREILALTGMTIVENGTPGKGARFEITVPEGRYRFAAS